MGTDICLCSEANNLGVERYVTKNDFTLHLFELTVNCWKRIDLSMLQPFCIRFVMMRIKIVVET